MNPDEIQTLARQLKAALAINGVLAVMNLVTLVGVMIFVVGEPAEVAGVNPLETQAEAEAETDPRQEMRDFFERTSDLLDRAARRNGTNPAEILPTQAEIDAAVETRTIHSDEAQAVMSKLREGYDYYDLDWPLVVPQR